MKASIAPKVVAFRPITLVLETVEDYLTVLNALSFAATESMWTEERQQHSNEAATLLRRAYADAY